VPWISYGVSLNMEKIRLLLADDHVVVRQGLRVLLEAESDLIVVGEAENGRQAVRLAVDLSPDIILMDIAMPQLNGLEATRQIAKGVPSTRVLVLSAYNEAEYVRQFIKAGAAGYLAKHTAAADLIHAVRAARDGKSCFSPSLSKGIREQSAATFANFASREDGQNLTTRETEVLQLIAEGAPNKQIAAELFISIKTVEKHRQQVMNKLNIHHIAGLTRFAISRGVIELPVMSAKSG